ncbi:hypothetical protein J2Z83_002596 [Virgibacillus natechei]|uniref:Uncharacterized protein n=1 Tax=Virgibacillus natechei TaxID=1216297 RepID=A0ABS4IIR5_9BACI|nr:hypothetical protein [Virgibacillus natechei]MBP1970475.1 hypothetical protein [Virgibacillus natechei]UZD13876.1 hypothetical protein OLD84_04890 [Virgibacillus natechei]
MSDERKNNESSKDEQLELFRVDDKGKKLTTNQGLNPRSSSKQIFFHNHTKSRT